MEAQMDYLKLIWAAILMTVDGGTWEQEETT
jgi:hypothetical protein